MAEPERVPRLDWPLRCRGCRNELTGEPVEGGRVVCPTCGRLSRYPPLSEARRSLRMLVLIVCVLASLLVFLTVMVTFFVGRVGTGGGGG